VISHPLDIGDAWKNSHSCSTTIRCGPRSFRRGATTETREKCLCRYCLPPCVHRVGTRIFHSSIARPTDTSGLRFASAIATKLADRENDAGKAGWKPEQQTTARPVDTWTEGYRRDSAARVALATCSANRNRFWFLLTLKIVTVSSASWVSCLLPLKDWSSGTAGRPVGVGRAAQSSLDLQSGLSGRKSPLMAFRSEFDPAMKILLARFEGRLTDGIVCRILPAGSMVFERDRCSRTYR